MNPAMNQGMKGQQAAGMTFGQPISPQAKGRSPDSMNQIMALAKKMSDAQLADVLAGRSMDIPQFAAMTEAMGRKSLRNAVQGAQAMAQAKQPTIKDKLLAESQMLAGLDQLPAPNMASVDMADGGIVAFNGEDESLVKEPEFGTEAYNEKYGAPGSLKRKFKSIRDYYASPSSAEGVGRNIMNTANAMAPMSFGAGVTGGQFIPKTGGIVTGAADWMRKLIGTTGAANAVLGGEGGSQALPVPTGDGTEVPPKDDKKVVPSAEQALTDKGGKGDGGGKGGSGGLGDLMSYEDLMKKRSTDYLSKFEGLGEKKRAGIKDLKNQLQSQLLLQGASALLGSRNLAEAGGKFGQQAASTVAAGRAEQRQIEDAADQYDFNIAKAREAAEKGDMQLAMQYAQLANQNKYQMGMLDVYKQRNAIMGEAGNMGKVSMALNQADKQALAEAKQKFPVLTKNNQAAFDAYLRKRATELKMGNPLTKQYANLTGADLGGGAFNVVQSLPKGASVVDLD